MIKPNSASEKITVGIDATNLRGGGGMTHLIEILRAVEPSQHGVGQVVVWGGKQILSALTDRSWLKKMNPPELDRGLMARSLWQFRQLSSEAEANGCQVIFVPGGSFSRASLPVVAMCQNMLPFEWQELRRFGWSRMTLKLLLLRSIQSRSFRRAAGMIFPTQYTKQGVLKVVGTLPSPTAVIPHGLNDRFRAEPRKQCRISQYNQSRPYRIIYVSPIYPYKHQWNVVEAVSWLRKEGWPIQLDLVGPAYFPALGRLNATKELHDPDEEWVKCHGAIPYNEMHDIYSQSDLGVFASSCETFGYILLEKMAAGLPVACSSCSALTEVLGNAGVYFDPERPSDISRALRELISSPDLRSKNARSGFLRAQRFSHEKCAFNTFDFLVKITRQYHDVKK